MKAIVANEIRNQLGHHCLLMVGAKNLLADENSLSFKIMPNSKKVSHLRITLNGMDLYNIEYLKCGKSGIKVLSEEKNLYADMLHESIESNTGLYTSL